MQLIVFLLLLVLSSGLVSSSDSSIHMNGLVSSPTGIRTINYSTLSVYGVKVYRPTGPSSLAMQCNEYGYVRFRITHPDILSSAAYFDLSFLSTDDSNPIQKIIEKAPIQQVGYIAFFPWNEPALSATTNYSIGINFYDDDENELEFRSIAANQMQPNTFKQVLSPAFRVPECNPLASEVNS